jgi:hypothetical protein
MSHRSHRQETSTTYFCTGCYPSLTSFLWLLALTNRRDLQVTALRLAPAGPFRPPHLALVASLLRGLTTTFLASAHLPSHILGHLRSISAANKKHQAPWRRSTLFVFPRPRYSPSLLRLPLPSSAPSRPTRTAKPKGPCCFLSRIYPTDPQELLIALALSGCILHISSLHVSAV